MTTYEQEFQKALDTCAEYYSESQIDNMSAYEIQYEYGRILASKLLKEK